MGISDILEHLSALVGCDTQNPPRDIRGDSPVMDYCSQALGSDFEVEITDHGSGHVSFYAHRGRPQTLFNVHLDTVPLGPGWDSDPLELEVTDDRAVGRGACDIKGAAACLLAIASTRPQNLALLFTTDEEGAEGKCVRAFCESGAIKSYRQVIVAEPTACEAVLGHRGFLSVESLFHGSPGHSSEARALYENAIHQMTRWAASALDLAERQQPSMEQAGTCLNLGFTWGGTANNVIAGESLVRWSARLLPGSSNLQFLEEIKACAPGSARVDWQIVHDGKPLPAGGQNDTDAVKFAERLKLARGKDVDFWTEASIFSQFGCPAMVLGPGQIAQAHIANEWVTLAQLEQACELYGRIISNDE